MKYLTCCLLALIGPGLIGLRPDPTAEDTKWPSYSGAWFEIEYPPGFEVRPGMESYGGHGHLSAFFVSPDRAVEFYVFSPLWSGSPRDILLNPATEEAVSSKTYLRGYDRYDDTEIEVEGDLSAEEYGLDVPLAEVTWKTIRARDGSYTRSYVDVAGESTFGIKYVNAGAYERYRNQYLRFRQSLRRWPRYSGAWFNVECPPDFEARPGMRSLTSGDGHDSAFFLSPDRTVEFYVFSPQWYGEPSDILLDPATEELVSSKTDVEKEKVDLLKSDGTESEVEREAARVTWQTIRAKDGSYTRSYVDMRYTGMRYPIGQSTFGIKYVNAEAYERYRKQYLRFKRSLVQFAD